MGGLRELVADGTTLLLTTQYLEEADQLADRIVVIDHGRIIAEGARQLTAPADGLADVTRIASVFDGSEIVLDDLGLKRPSLDDVFLHLTSRRAEETQTSDGPTSTARRGWLDE